MYLSQDSSKLIVIGSEYQVYALDIMVPREAMISPYLNEVRTFLNVYDVSDKVNPVLARNFTLSGSYFNSRMIGDYVYAVVSQPAYILENNAVAITNSLHRLQLPPKLHPQKYTTQTPQTTPT